MDNVMAHDIILLGPFVSSFTDWDPAQDATFVRPSAGFPDNYSACSAQQCSVTYSSHSEIQKYYFLHFYFWLIFHLCTTVHRLIRIITE